LLDAGGVVTLDGTTTRFPHVPSYLPPSVFWAVERRRPIVASTSLHAAMAARTLYEIATGEAPQASKDIDHRRLDVAPVSSQVAQTIVGLSRGDYPDCRTALRDLAARADRRIRGAGGPPGR